MGTLIRHGINYSGHPLKIDVMQGATATEDGKEGLVPKPSAGEQELFLKADGTWADVHAIIDEVLTDIIKNGEKVFVLDGQID